MLPLRTNTKIEKNYSNGNHVGIVPAIQNGYMAAPAISFEIDRNAFKKSVDEKFKLFMLQKENRDERRAEFGCGYKKHLNVTRKSISKSVRMSF